MRLLRLTVCCVCVLYWVLCIYVYLHIDALVSCTCVVYVLCWLYIASVCVFVFCCLFAITELPTENRFSVLKAEIGKLPKANRMLLRSLLQFLSVCLDAVSETRMTAKNFAIVFGPNILRYAFELRLCVLCVVYA